MSGRSRKRARAPDVDPPFPSFTSPPASDPNTTPSASPTSTPDSGGRDITPPETQISSPPLDLLPWSWNSSSPPARRRRLSPSRSSRPPARTPPSFSPLPRPDQQQLVHGPPAPPLPGPYYSAVHPSRYVESTLANPYEQYADKRRLKGGDYRGSLEETEVNGYIKLAKRQLAPGARFQNNPSRECVSLRLSAVPKQWWDSLDSIDRRLFEFYIGSWCSGRTVLRKTNCWLKDIAQMAQKDDCVKHAILALAATYVVDYHPDEQLKQAALGHYKGAVVRLTLLLTSARQQTPSDRDAEALVAAIALLTMIDVVSPEDRTDGTIRWLEGARLACRVLDLTDPGYRYWDPVNIQPSDARVGNTIIASRTAILALPMAPLDLSHTQDKQFAWLLQGSEVNTRRIHGGCGMSPVLLYHFSQITHLAAFMHSDPKDTEFVITPKAYKMRDQLRSLEQWYEHETRADHVTHVSIDVRTIRDLLRAGHLDANGAIRTSEGMTASTAEAWRLAAIIYLQCRVLRLPRTHPDVLSQVSNLAACIRVMPTSGFMFTAQAPFFPVFLLGIVAVEEGHSQCALHWFDSVISTGCRSSVPPAYEALKEIRSWMAVEIRDTPLPVSERISARHAWWEDVVEQITEVRGTLCLV